jgi:pimeloyl-ACP methyl ester carboxylesterase
VRAVAEEDDEKWDEQIWISRFDPAWPMYFADPYSPLSAPHLAHIDILPSLAAVKCPTLVIAGQHDFICGPAWDQPIAAAIPGARYIEIADTGHLPQYEQPGAFRAALLDWLATT